MSGAGSIQIVGPSGKPLNVEPTGNMPIEWQDQHSEIVDIMLCSPLGPVTIAVDTTIGTSTITLSAGHGFVSGNYICINENQRFYQAMCISVETNVITLDTPLDYAFTTSALAYRRSTSLAVDGSVTPVIFSVKPPAGTKWDITRMILQMVDDAEMDDSKFGGINALTNGIFFRHKNGLYKNIFNSKTNGDLALHAYDVSYSTKAKFGEYGLSMRRSFSGIDKNGVTIRLDGDLDDEFQCIVQDDLTGLISFKVCIQGHVLEGL